MAEHTAHDKHHHHVVPPWLLGANLCALAILMFATIKFSEMDLGATWINNIVAIAIALVKMMLVILIFMGVHWSTRLTKLWAATGFVWFLLMGIIFGDYFTRDWEAVPGWHPDQRDYPTHHMAGAAGEDEAAAGGEAAAPAPH